MELRPGFRRRQAFSNRGKGNVDVSRIVRTSRLFARPSARHRRGFDRDHRLHADDEIPGADDDRTSDGYRSRARNIHWIRHFGRDDHALPARHDRLCSRFSDCRPVLAGSDMAAWRDIHGRGLVLGRSHRHADPRRRLLFWRRQGSHGRAHRACRFRCHPGRERAPAFPARPSMVAVMNVSRQRVVIVGGGFGGLSAARALARVAVDVTLIDRHNYHLFQPLLYQVATAALAPNTIAAPIRAILRAQKNATVLMETVSAAAKRALERLGVEVRVGKPVTACDADGVMVGGERIEARSILWAAGVAASPAAQWLKAPADRAGRVEVCDDLSLSGHPEIFVIGDTCLSKSWDGKPAPGIAPAAKQMGAYAARVIRTRVEGTSPSPPPPFRYRHD